MRRRQQYGIIIRDKEGPLCKAFSDDFQQAKLHAQNLADEEGCECFVSISSVLWKWPTATHLKAEKADQMVVQRGPERRV